MSTIISSFPIAATSTPTAAQALSARAKIGLTRCVRNVRELGIVPSASPPGSNDTAARINTAYQDAITGGYSLEFDFEPGKYYFLESPLLCFKSNGSTFQTVDLPALIGTTGFQAYAGEQAVQFMATHTGPCIITQGGRGFTAKNLWLRTYLGGSYANYAASGYTAATTAQRFTDHTLWNGSVFSHTRYAPSCGIAIDPFGSSVPSDDRYSGLSTYYSHSAAYSSAVAIENCTFAYNRIGVLIGSGVSSNSDGVTIRHCKFSKLKYCVVTCHAQTKNIIVDRPSIAEVWCVLANSVHGAQNGIWPAITNPDNCSYIGNIFGGDGLVDVIHPDYQVEFDGNGSNWEDVGRIGYFGESQGQRGPVSIRNAQIGFAQTGAAHFKSGRPTVVQNCKWLLNASASDKIWIESQCQDDMPGTWDSGYQGNVKGTETRFDSCSFSVSGAAETTLGGLLNFGALTTGKKNWIRFVNCKGYCGDVTNLYQNVVNNIRGGSLA
jgi:hypothetical protein